MPSERYIKIADEFSDTPFGRYAEDGPDSGEVFRDKFLLPELIEGNPVVLDIDDVAGLPSSFWEEALGGSIRAGVSLEDMRRLVKIVTTQRDLETYVRGGWLHVEKAWKELNARRG